MDLYLVTIMNFYKDHSMDAFYIVKASSKKEAISKADFLKESDDSMIDADLIIGNLDTPYFIAEK